MLKLIIGIDANDDCEGDTYTKFCTLNLGTTEKEIESSLPK